MDLILKGMLEDVETVHFFKSRSTTIDQGRGSASTKLILPLLMPTNYNGMDRNQCDTHVPGRLSLTAHSNPTQ